MKRQLLTSDEATTCKTQPKSPCSDCPFARYSLQGWLAGESVGRWLAAAHNDGRMECHTTNRPDGEAHQCAGAAIYRANVCKFVQPPNLKLETDRETVFASPAEFAEHHSRGKIKTPEQVREAFQEGLEEAMNESR